MLIGALLCLILCVFEGWFIGGVRNGLSHPASRGNLVDSHADALALRKPYLLTATAKLVDLPANQQPATDPRRQVLDASYFRGKYYVYYGILPFLAYSDRLQENAPDGFRIDIIGRLKEVKGVSLKNYLRQPGSRSVILQVPTP